MNRFSLLLSALSATSASVVNCGSQWPVHSFVVDPPAAVGAGQNVSMTATFTIPAGWPTIDEFDGILRVKGTLAYLIDMEVVEPLCKYLKCPLTPGTYTWNWKESFPVEAYGRVQTELTLSGLVGAKPWLCLRWTAFATGRASNETNTAIKWLYS